jgi:hypothetical protein
MPSRTARQCRDRFKNYLGDFLVTNPWTAQEDALVIRQYHLIGPKWVEIGKMLSGRSGNNVKNRWHKHLCKREGARGPVANIQMMSPNPVNEIEAPPFPDAYRPSEVEQFEWRPLFQTFDTPRPSGFLSFNDSFF